MKKRKILNMALLRLRCDTKQISPVESFISKHSACDVSHHKVFTREHQLFKTASKGVENSMFYSYNQPQDLRP